MHAGACRPWTEHVKSAVVFPHICTRNPIKSVDPPYWGVSSASPVGANEIFHE